MRGTGTFDPTKPAVVNDPFVFDGVSYATGTPFPHVALNLHRIDLLGLWKTGRVVFVDSPPPITPAALPAATAQATDAVAVVSDAELERLTAPGYVAGGSFDATPSGSYALPLAAFTPGERGEVALPTVPTTPLPSPSPAPSRRGRGR